MPVTTPVRKSNDPDDALGLSISAWMDGDENVAFPQNMLDSKGKQTWQVYHLIGDALRTPELAQVADNRFQERLARALDQEPVVMASVQWREQTQSDKRGSSRKPSVWQQYGWPSLAMAAAVAAVVWVARPFLLPETSGEQTAQVALSVPASAEAAIAPDYVAAHRQVAGPAAVRQVSFGGIK